MKETLLFLDELDFLLKCAEDTYALYLKNQKTFLFAKILRRQNQEIRVLLRHNGFIAPEDIQPEILALFQHLNVWCEIWDHECEARNPALGDEFVFENAVNFPKDAVESLRQHKAALTGDH
ncbi:MAG: hypothetical protein GY952_16905 [Rhodobacteraceae bacterium]|nr:hypothetical protein [Paracoccaceae bacterium]